MVLTYSQAMQKGTIAPDFTLPDTVSGKPFSLSSLQNKPATVIMFMCNHCPYVKHIQEEIVNLAKEYQKKEVAFVAISSNDIEEYPQDAPNMMKQNAEAFGYTFPYLYDESQAVAKAYGVECTPEFLLFDQALKSVYHGRFDDATPGKPTPVTGKDLRAALDAVLAGRPVEAEFPSMGCNIKWKKIK